MQRYPRVFLSNSSSSALLDLVAVKEVLNRLWLLNVFLILVVYIYIYIYILSFSVLYDNGLWILLSVCF